MKPICDDPFSGDYSEAFPGVGHVEFTARGECGMGGPSRGRLSINGIQICDEALPSCASDQKQEKLAFFEIRFDGPVRCILHVLDSDRKQIYAESLDFAAYSVIFTGPTSLLIRDEYAKQTKEIKIE
jgi:hypothetical protein